MVSILLRYSFLLLLGTAAASCSQPTSGQQNTATASVTEAAGPAAQGCAPVETRKPNAKDQRPAFNGQTRACAIKTSTPFEVRVVAKGLEKPWSVEPLTDGSFLVTEKPGRLRHVSASGAVGAPITGLPAVDYTGQGGLLDLCLSPDFGTSHLLFWSFSEPRQGGNATSVARGVLSKDFKKLEQVRVIFRALPAYDGGLHFGSRLAFDQDGLLYVTLGERSDLETRPQAQHLNSHLGKLLRITKDGKPAPGNPFIGQPDALPEIWTLGQRNVQASAFDAQGQLWTVDMGPQGGDELNLIQKGKNYGWPLVTFGEEYSGQPVPNSVTDKPGFERPVYYWDPVIAPSGAQFYSGKLFPEWRGNLFVGGLRGQCLVRLRIENNRVSGEEHLLKDRNERIRDVKQGPDGALYVVTDNSDGELWKIVPKK